MIKPASLKIWKILLFQKFIPLCFHHTVLLKYDVKLRLKTSFIILNKTVIIPPYCSVSVTKTYLQPLKYYWKCNLFNDYISNNAILYGIKSEIDMFLVLLFSFCKPMEPSVKTPHSTLSAEFTRHCVLSGGTQGRTLPWHQNEEININSSPSENAPQWPLSK